jgi:hypothetical protein
MPTLRLESPTDSLDLGGIIGSGYGTAALDGVNGVGFPNVSVQWVEGAGDGAVWRGERVLARDVDVPILINAPDRATLRATTSRLARMLAGPMTFRFTEDDGTSWTLDVRRNGGGQMVLGTDTNRNVTQASTVLSLRTNRDPFWTSSVVQRVTVNSLSGRGLLSYDADGPGPGARGGSSLSFLRVSSSQTLGAFQMTNDGDAPAYPKWTVTGPGQNFTATSATGETFQLWSILTAGQSVVIDTKAGTVIDNTGTSRYFELAPAPRLWKVPPGTTTANIALTGSTSATSVTVEWSPRRWTVV